MATIEYQYKIDTAGATASIRALAESERQAAESARQMQAAALGITEAERQLAAQVIQATAATNAAAAADRDRAAALGLTVDQLQRVKTAQAASTAAAESKAVEAQVRAYEDLTGSVRNYAGTAPGAAEGTARNAAAMSNLRSQVVDMGVMLQGGANPLTIIVTQGPQVAEALASMDGGIAGVISKLAAFGPAAAVVTAAVLALGGAWLYYADQLEEAEAAAEGAASAATRAQKAHAEWSGISADLAQEVRVVSGALTEEGAAAEDQIASWEASRQAHRAILAEKYELTKAAQDNEGATVAETRANRDALEALTAYDAQTQRTSDTIALIAEKREIERKARERAIEAARAQRQAEAWVNEQLREAARLLEDLDRRLDAQAAARQLLLEAASLGDPIAVENERWRQQKEAIEAATKALGDQALGRQALAAAEAEHNQILDDMEAKAIAALEATAALGEKTSADYAKMSKDAAETTTSGSTVLSAAGSLSGLASADPTGITAAVVAGLQVVSSSASGGGAIGELQTLLTGFAEGLPNLPKVIGDFLTTTLSDFLPAVMAQLPSVVGNLIPLLIESLITSLPDLAAALVQMAVLIGPQIGVAMMAILLDAGFWKDVAQQFVTSLGDALKGLVDSLIQIITDAINIFDGKGGGGGEGPVREKLNDIGQTIGSWGEAAFGGKSKDRDSFAVGGRVGERASYVVHANEVNAGGYVVPASGMEPSTVRHGYQSRAGGATVVVNMGSGIVLGTAEALGRAMALETQRLAFGAP